jgi:O-antigen biosynthesis protein
MKQVDLRAIGLGLVATVRALQQRFTDIGRASKSSVEPGERFDGEHREIFDYFDGEWYLEANKDVADAGMDPLQHFLDYGEGEGRDPSRAFSTSYYRETYMQDEPLGASPLRHFMKVGRALGFEPMPAAAQKYRVHLAAQNQSYGLEIPELLRHIQLMPIRPYFLVYLDGDESAVGSVINSALHNQIYPNWTVCDTKEVVAQQMRGSSEEPRFLVWLGHDDVLHSSAFYCLASTINADPNIDLIYGDEDQITDEGDRSNPFFKPDWSPDYLESCNFLGAGTCVRGAIVDRIFDESSGLYDFLLRATELSQRVSHIRQVLVHRVRGLDRSKRPDQIAKDIAAIEGRLKRTGRSGTVTPLKPDIGCYLVNIFRLDTPLISVVVPTAGRIVDVDGRKIDLILNCLDAVMNRSSYKNLEFIVIDNGDIDDVRMSELHARGVKTIEYREPALNVAKKLNLGAAACRGEFLLLLNDDVEPLTEDWIERLLDHLEKPHVGVVGAKLLYPDMTTQHVGVVLINGKPGYQRTRYPRTDEGYFFSSCAVRNFVAVTGAVMLTRTSLFREVGGYSETLPVKFNDIDYCLKLQERGYYSVFIPQAELIHYESMSRPREVHGSEVDHFLSRWTKIVTDPFYNEHELTISPPTFEVCQKARPIG